jgi:hypothetical protein
VKHGYIKSSPRFFRLIRLSMLIFTVSLLILAVLVPAPLQEQASIARVPNPVKSAWFLLWIQELVSYSKHLINLVILLAFCFLLLPWLPGSKPAREARWRQGDQPVVTAVALLTFLVIVALTVIAMSFRGENWAFLFAF